MRSFPTVCATAFLTALAGLAGCASQPASTSAPVTAPVAPEARLAVLNSGQGVAAEPVAATAPDRRSGVPAGYKSVERDGTTLYCTKVATLGTKFKKELCMTPDEYDEMQRRNEGMRQDLRKSTSMCSGGSGAFACSGNSG